MSKLLLIHTGGTIGMELAGNPPEKDDFLKRLQNRSPHLFEMGEIHAEMLFNKDSSDISPLHWMKIARLIDKNRMKFDAFVLTHGTDTMAFTASALSFLLRGINKPVILTGSQKPLIDQKSDAQRNLIYSVEIALEKKVPEVCIFFDDVLLRGNRAKKTSTSSFGAFTAPNHFPLARTGVKTRYNYPQDLPHSDFKFSYNMDPNILVFTAFPGWELESEWILEKKIKAVVIQGFGPGNLPSSEKTTQSIRNLKNKSIPVILMSQIHHGEADPHLYQTGRQALEAGAIESLDMTFEAVVCKTMFLLGNNVENFKEEFHRNYAGELSI